MASSAAASSSQTPLVQANSLQVFHPFKLLPLELRQMIWLQAALEPRVVEFAFYESYGKNRRETRNTSKTLVPALLHTCSESRAVGLTHYERLTPTGVFTGTYINWSQDFVYLDCSQGQFFDFQRKQETYRTQPGYQKDILPRECRRLLLGRRLYGPRDVLFKIFDQVEEVAVVHKGDEWSYDYDVHDEISGPNGGDISLEAVSHDDQKSTIEEPPSVDYYTGLGFPYDYRIRNRYYRSYRPVWSYIEKNRERWKKVSLVKVIRGHHRPLSREEKTNRRERERQEQLDNQAPQKPQRVRFENWRVSELRLEAETRGLNIEGSKSELVTRLQADEYIPYSRALEEYDHAMEEYRKAKQDRSSVASQQIDHAKLETPPI